MSKFVRAFKKDSPSDENKDEFSNGGEKTNMVPFNSFSPTRGGFLQMNDGDMVPKDNLPIPPETAAEGGIWKKVGDWDTGYQKDDILYIKKLDNKLKFQYYTKETPQENGQNGHVTPPRVIEVKNNYTPNGAVTPTTNGLKTAKPIEINTCPYGHGSVGVGPYPNYIHGKHPEICPNGCKPILTLGAHGDSSETWRDTLFREAVEYQMLYNKDNHIPKDQADRRMQEVKRDILMTGTYYHTVDEMRFGTRVAWRNAPKCANRKHWDCLEVIDARHCATEDDMFKSCLSLLERAAETCALTANILMFRPSTPGTNDGARCWNNQLLRFACYREGLSECLVGDPSELGFTQMLEIEYGWKAPNPRTRFDLLPLMLQAHPDRAPLVREMPSQYGAMVILRHPRFEWFESLGLRWYAIPIVSNINVTIGGLLYTGCPFNGWYSVTEIVRNLTDDCRYNLTKAVANKMGLNTNLESSLWRDLAVSEIGVAILYSFGRAGYGITDHHTMLETFYDWYYKEIEDRGYCPGNWKWMIPPMAPSQTRCYLGLAKMTEYTLKPAYIAGPMWMKFRRQWLDNPASEGHMSRRVLSERKEGVFKFYYIYKFCRLLLQNHKAKKGTIPQVTIIFVTNAGNSRQKAAKVFERLHSYIPKLTMVDAAAHNADDMYNKIKAANYILFITSTYGSGDVPKAGLKLLKLLDDSEMVEEKKMSHITFSVLGLGSTAYPRFCAAADAFYEGFTKCGATPLFDELVRVDEMNHPEATSIDWMNKVLREFERREILTWAAVEELGGHQMPGVVCEFKPSEPLFTVNKLGFEVIKRPLAGVATVVVGASKVADKFSTTTHLEIIIPRERAKNKLVAAGDEVMIAATNEAEDVNRIGAALGLIGKQLDELVTLQSVDPSLPAENYPFETPQTIRNILTHYLAINDVLSYDNIRTLSYLCPLDSGLAAAAESFEAYKNSIYILNMKWKDVFHHFPSLYGKVTATHLVSMVPLIRMRYYSLASAPKHITLDAATLSKVVFDKGELDFEVGRLEKMQPGDEYTPEAGDLQIDLVVASHTFVNHAKARDNGFCSSWLNSRKKNDIIYLNTVSMQSFRLPYDIKTPVVLVGTGAGIAPLRSFWQERARRIAHENSIFRLTQPRGDFVLVFGCRDDSEASELFKEEIKRCGHVFSKVEIAYSRMAPTFPKRYVQDVVSQSEYLRKVIAHPTCQIMICGSVNMATGVELAITNQIGNNAMKKFKQEGRFKLDVFGAKN